MATYLDTSQVSSELMQLLKEAKEKIILITYSLQVNSQIQERLKTKSKLGTLSEITIIYGNTILKSNEIKWMEEIDDLKIWQKRNLHAKCYLNEKKAIITSMNLYDYSQTTNIEMGVLINKDEHPEAYDKILADIADLKINGDRKKIEDLIKESKTEKKTENNFDRNKLSESTIQNKTQVLKSNFSYKQQIGKHLLEKLRKSMSIYLKQQANTILSDELITKIITQTKITKSSLISILENDKKAKQLGDDILMQIKRSDDYTIGQIVDTRYEGNHFNYDQVKMEIFNSGITKWFDTKVELPRKGQIVGVILNDTWFNKYIILDESDIVDEINENEKKDYSKSKYLTTKEIAQNIGLSSQTINSVLVSESLMEKVENDWLATETGKKVGGIQKEGQYGKFVIWPEEIINDIKFK